MQWYYSKGGTQLGPVSQPELIAKIAAGEVSASDLAWKDGMSDWLPVAKISELQGLTVTAPVSTVSPTSAPVAASPYTAPTQISSPVTGQIPTYLWQSIVVTCLCCLPFGIPAIVYAAKVDGLQARGDIAGALAASKSAKTWTIVSLCCGLAVLLFYAISIGLAASSGQLPH